MTTFDQCFDIVIGTEGGFSADPADPGNWTGGRPGHGVCRGTKFGISAAAYPDINIPTLTVAQARELYKRDYWGPVCADRLPPPLALLAFDAAVNNGVRSAAIWLQQAAGAAADGVIGPQTLAAIETTAGRPDGGAGVCAEFLARRLAFMAALPTWRSFGLGWARRLCRLPYQSLTVHG